MAVYAADDFEGISRRMRELRGEPEIADTPFTNYVPVTARPPYSGGFVSPNGSPVDASGNCYIHGLHTPPDDALKVYPDGSYRDANDVYHDSEGGYSGPNGEMLDVNGVQQVIGTNNRWVPVTSPLAPKP